MERRRFYIETINKNVKLIKEVQGNGCFDYNYNNKLSSYPNARMQEAVASLAWIYSKGNKKIKGKIEEGIDFWCKIQKKSGYFSEHSKYEQSFAATAYSTAAIGYAISIIGMDDKWKTHLRLASEWLTKNNELILINQQAAAALSLFYTSKILKSGEYKLAAEIKLKNVLKSQKGYFPEKNSFDLGYSTLTLYLLTRIHQITKKREIIQSTEQFLEYFIKQEFPKNIRNTNWIIIGGFEYLANKCKSGEKALKIVLENYNTNHLPDTRHICTDLIQFCLAYDNVNVNKSKIPRIFVQEKIKNKPSKILNIIRPFGLHKIRNWWYK